MTDLPAVQRARRRQAVAWVLGVARDVVGWADNWGGSVSIRNPSVLGRCIRDISVGRRICWSSR